MPKRFYVETLGCPKNAVDSDKVVASLLADGLAPAAAGRGRRPRRGQHLRVHRVGPPRVDRCRARAGRREARPAPSSCSPVAWPSATATSSQAALPEADAVVGFAGEGGLASVVLKQQADRRPRPPGAAATRTVRAVGVREDRRGVRPRLRVLCDPVVPWHATLTDAGIDRDRSARARRARRERARPRGAGPRVVRPRHGRARRAHAAAAPARRPVGFTDSRASACCTCTPPRCTTRWCRRCSSSTRSSRTSTSPCSTRRRDCCAA